MLIAWVYVIDIVISVVMYKLYGVHVMANGYETSGIKLLVFKRMNFIYRHQMSELTTTKQLRI